MCGIFGLVSVDGRPVPRLDHLLRVGTDLIAHRGPDGYGTWSNPNNSVGLGHSRLAIIDLSNAASQPMLHDSGAAISYNGEIYNFLELRRELTNGGYRFRTKSDTEVILAAYLRHGRSFLDKLRGMFAFALWDESKRRLTLARDRFGIKPLYYTIQGDVLFFASEQKALLPFIPAITTNPSAMAEYLTFQYTISEETMFDGISQLMPGHFLVMQNGTVTISRYWDVKYEVDHTLSMGAAQEQLRALLDRSMEIHLRSDVEIGAYLSGGLDSSLIALLANMTGMFGGRGFHGRFTDYPGYDESHYAEIANANIHGNLSTIDISPADFEQNIRSVIWHLDQPTAGPGSFPQFMVSRLAAESVKVVLGGQGGDEIFGGYARYLIAYLEQCIKAAIDGTYRNGNYVVTIESIIPNLGLLREYKPLMQEFWREGLFGPLDDRFFRLVNRSNDMGSEIKWEQLELHAVKEKFKEIFDNRSNVRKEAYFDRMTHFEFKTLLPALLTVEDRMSMAHGLESRVPFLDHELVEFVATVPANLKFEGGQLKHLLKSTYSDLLPSEIVDRRDKMGFPVPLKEWFSNELSSFALDVFANMRSRKRDFFDVDEIVKNHGTEAQFSRKTWALMSLELWQQEFHDKASEYRALLK